MPHDLNKADRDVVLLALAVLSLQRPGWHAYLGDVAEQFGDREAFEEFRVLNEGRTPTVPAALQPLQPIAEYWREALKMRIGERDEPLPDRMILVRQNDTAITAGQARAFVEAFDRLREVLP